MALQRWFNVAGRSQIIQLSGCHDTGQEQRSTHLSELLSLQQRQVQKLPQTEQRPTLLSEH